MIDACLFDMGNVLVFFSHALMCEQIAHVCDCTTDEVRQILFDSKWQHEIERGEISEDEFHQRWQQHLNRDIDRAALIHAASDIFELNSEIVPVLQTLKDQGLRLILLSNTCISHMDFVRNQFQILNHFDGFVLSCDVGAMKPDPAIYLEAIKQAGCAAERCFYTDDIQENIEAGKTHGLHSELYTSVDELQAQLTRLGIRDL